MLHALIPSETWRIAVALSRDSWFFAISASRFLISVFRRELVAVPSSMAEVRAVMRASASSMAAVFSLSFVSHLRVPHAAHDAPEKHYLCSSRKCKLIRG